MLLDNLEPGGLVHRSNPARGPTARNEGKPTQALRSVSAPLHNAIRLGPHQLYDPVLGCQGCCLVSGGNGKHGRDDVGAWMGTDGGTGAHLVHSGHGHPAFETVCLGRIEVGTGSGVEIHKKGQGEVAVGGKEVGLEGTTPVASSQTMTFASIEPETPNFKSGLTARL